MLQLLALATLALSIPAPITVNFTSDSVYTHESIITPKEVIEQEDGLYTIVLEQNHLLGYCIYDNQDTSYIDGLKFDDEFVTNYIIENVDLSVEHTILIKTVYTDDVAGMLVAAKDGDWSRILSNPLIISQLVYYILAALSVVLGGFGLLKAKKSKIKTTNEITKSIDDKAAVTSEHLKNLASGIVTSLITPTITKLQSQNQALIEAFILAQSGDKNSKLALIELLKTTANEDISLFSESVQKAIEEAANAKEKAKEEATKIIEEIATSKPESDDRGGFTI